MEWADLDGLSVGRCWSKGSGRDKKADMIMCRQTKLGLIPVPEWCRMVHELAREQGEELLLAQLAEWLEKWTFVSNMRPREKDEYICSCHVKRLFDQPEWVDYQAFNSCYRPKIFQQIIAKE